MLVYCHDALRNDSILLLLIEKHASLRIREVCTVVRVVVDWKCWRACYWWEMYGWNLGSTTLGSPQSSQPGWVIPSIGWQLRQYRILLSRLDQAGMASSGGACQFWILWQILMHDEVDRLRKDLFSFIRHKHNHYNLQATEMMQLKVRLLYAI